jgi:chemotaxis protein methyltransferase CheR
MSVRDAIAAFVAARTGMELKRGGIDKNLESHAARREKELGVSPHQYLGLLELDESRELERLVNAVTVGYTWFFRDPGQLHAIEALLLARPIHAPKLRLWIPGCSTGEDAYSLAFIAERAGRSLELLATDVNSDSIEHARRGVYGAWSARDVEGRFSELLLKRPDGAFEVLPRLRERVRFQRHNLVDRAPLPAAGGGWDIILCRNVLIYFERRAALRVLSTLARALAPGGHLLLGASEVMCEPPAGLVGSYVAERLTFRRATVLESVQGADAGSALPPWPLPVASSGPGSIVSAFPANGAAVARSLPPPPPRRPELEGHLERGHRLIDAGDAAGARAAYVEAQKADPDRADVHMYVGIAHYLCGMLEDALHALRAALFLDEGLWPAAFYLALCHENSGHPAEALSAFRHVVRIDDRDRAQAVTRGSTFEAWREDLCDLARRRVSAAEQRAPAGAAGRL